MTMTTDNGSAYLAVGPANTDGPAVGGATAEFVAELRTRIEALTDSVAVLREQLLTSRDKHRADIATIGAKLTEEANDRRWCSDFDEIVDSLNSDLFVTLPTREKEYQVTVMVRMEITVSAKDEDDAISKARDVASEAESTVDQTDGLVSNWDDSYSYEVECTDD